MLRGLILMTLVLCSTPAIAQAGPAGVEGAGRWDGWITDATCGAKGANAQHSDCAKKCFERGVKLLLYSTQDQRLYELDRQDLAREQIGHEVTVSGTLEGDVIAVGSIDGPQGAPGPAIVKIDPHGAPGTAAAQGRIIKVERWTLAPVTIAAPGRSLDTGGNLRVALYLPAVERGNTVWFRGWWDNPHARIIEVDVDFATPFAEALTRGVRRIFPRCEVVRSAPSPGVYDLVLQAELRTETWQTPGAHSFLGFVARGRLTIEEEALGQLDLVEVAEKGVTNKFHWSSQRVTEDAGAPALRGAVNSLLQGLLASSPLARCVARLEEGRAHLPGDWRDRSGSAACQTIARAGSEPAPWAEGEHIARHIAAPAEPPDYQPEEPHGAPQGDRQRSQAAARPSVTAAATSDQYGRLRVKIEPDDASVYLDGRFVGTGSDLAGNAAGLLLAPGHHQLSVVRPGHRAEERSFDEVLGKDIDLTVTLSRTRPPG